MKPIFLILIPIIAAGLCFPTEKEFSIAKINFGMNRKKVRKIYNYYYKGAGLPKKYNLKSECYSTPGNVVGLRTYYNNSGNVVAVEIIYEKLIKEACKEVLRELDKKYGLETNSIRKITRTIEVETIITSNRVFKTGLNQYHFRIRNIYYDKLLLKKDAAKERPIPESEKERNIRLFI